MRLETRARHLPLDAHLRDHIERRVRSAVGRVAGHLRRVVVQLVDLNGPRGGLDVRCRIQAFLDRSHPLVVESVGPDPYAAVSTAADRIGRTTVRSLERRRTRRRRLGARPA